MENLGREDIDAGITHICTGIDLFGQGVREYLNDVSSWKEEFIDTIVHMHGQLQRLEVELKRLL